MHAATNVYHAHVVGSRVMSQHCVYGPLLCAPGVVGQIKHPLNQTQACLRGSCGRIDNTGDAVRSAGLVVGIFNDRKGAGHRYGLRRFIPATLRCLSLWLFNTGRRLRSIVLYGAGQARHRFLRSCGRSVMRHSIHI